ncbi:MAG: hypothetical protein HYZ13_16650 [Acidobacteria bacterium]|nr:hypothetical protein [Acidobacteriota bacterium]
MSPLEEDPLHPISPVLRARPSRPVQVPPRTLRVLNLPGNWQGADRRKRNRRRAVPEVVEPPPETYDELGHILHPHLEEEHEIPHVDLEA